MTDAQKLLHQLRLVSDADAPQIAARLLRCLAKDITDSLTRWHFESTSVHIENLPLCWEPLSIAIFEASMPPWLNSACEPEPPDAPEISYEGQSVFNEIAALCRKREKRLRSISLTVSPGAMRHVPKLTNLDKNSIIPKLKRRIRTLGLSENPQFILPANMSSGDILDFVSAMREAVFQRDMGAAFSDEGTMEILNELEALHGILLHYRNERGNKAAVNLSFYALPGFVYCDQCWRMLPESYACRQMSRCDLHNYQIGKSTDSRKGKAVHKILIKKNPVFPNAVAKQLARINAVWKPRYGGLPEDAWLYALENNCAARHVVEKLPHVFYDLAPVWECCPRSRQFIIDQGGDPQSVASVISVLDPSLQGETAAEQEARASLHLFLERNFWFYRQDLALAEVWLEIHASQYAARKHGGPRPNSGGKRPGAGRPRKKPK